MGPGLVPGGSQVGPRWVLGGSQLASSKIITFSNLVFGTFWLVVGSHQAPCLVIFRIVWHHFLAPDIHIDFPSVWAWNLLSFPWLFDGFPFAHSPYEALFFDDSIVDLHDFTHPKNVFSSFTSSFLLSFFFQNQYLHGLLMRFGSCWTPFCIII